MSGNSERQAPEEILGGFFTRPCNTTVPHVGLHALRNAGIGPHALRSAERPPHTEGSRE